MKKSLVVVVAFAGLALVSCKKDYSCTCDESGVNYYDSDFDGIDDAHPYADTYTYKIEGANKTEAHAACNEATLKQQEGMSTYQVKCDLSK